MMDPHCFFRREQELYAKNYGALKDRFDPQPCSYIRFQYFRVRISLNCDCEEHRTDRNLQKTNEIDIADGKLSDKTIVPWLQDPVLPGCSELRVM